MARRPKREFNPISAKVERYLKASRSGVALEELCVFIGVKYKTLRNIFDRNRVSPLVLQALRHKEVITESDEKEYRAWLAAGK